MVVVVVVRFGTVVVVEVFVSVEVTESWNGFEVSILSERGWAVVATLPRVSVAVAETDQVPSESVGNEQPVVVAETTNVHVSVSEPLVADTTTEAPASTPGISNCGVESEVMLSVDDAPESLEAARSGVAGTVGLLLSIVTGSEGPAGDVFPAGSV